MGKKSGRITGSSLWNNDSYHLSIISEFIRHERSLGSTQSCWIRICTFWISSMSSDAYVLMKFHEHGGVFQEAHCHITKFNKKLKNYSLYQNPKFGVWWWFIDNGDSSLKLVLPSPVNYPLSMSQCARIFTKFSRWVLFSFRFEKIWVRCSTFGARFLSFLPNMG